MGAWAQLSGRRIDTFCGDVTDAAFTRELIGGFCPHAVVHFAEQRSALYLMIDQAHAVYTQRNNVIGTLNLLFAFAETDFRVLFRTRLVAGPICPSQQVTGRQS